MTTKVKYKKVKASAVGTAGTYKKGKDGKFVFVPETTKKKKKGKKYKGTTLLVGF